LTVQKNTKADEFLSTADLSDLGVSLDQLVGGSLDYAAREGARIILEVALNQEVGDFLGRAAYQRAGPDQSGYRNGSRPRSLRCGSGEIQIRKPKVVGAAEPFESKILPRWQRASNALLDVLPALYVEGLSTRDFKRALKPLLKGTGLSRSSISRINARLKESFNEWRKRDLSEEKIVYLFLDGYYLGVGRYGRAKDALLIAHGVREDGKRVLLGVYFGARESIESWIGAVRDLVDRGMCEPRLVITDGNPGLLRALKEVLPEVPNQRCTAHKTRNVLARVKKSRQEEVKRSLGKIFHAACLEDALRAAEEFHRRYGKEFPSATEVLAKGLSECLTFYTYPEVHWRRIRTSNVIERAFREVRRRTNVIGRLPDEGSALALVFGVLEEDRLKWRGLQMDDDQKEGVVLAFERLREKPLVIEWANRSSSIAEADDDGLTDRWLVV
jgi:transposase-like protein